MGVSVTRIVVEYVAAGQKFSVALNPETIGSIILTREDLIKAGGDPNDTGGPKFDPLKGTSDEPGHVLGFESLGEALESPPSTASLWWHARSCTFTHAPGG